LQDRSSKGRGFYNQIPLVKSKSDTLIPTKATDKRLTDTEKYGGYSGKLHSCHSIIKEETKKGSKLVIESISTKDASFLNSKPEQREKANLSNNDSEIIFEKLYVNTLVKLNGQFPARIAGMQELTPAAQNIIPPKNEIYLKKITNLFGENGKITKDEKYELLPRDGITKEENEELYNLLKDKLDNSIFKHNPAVSKLNEQLKNNFFELSLIGQSKTIFELLKFFKAGAVVAPDFSFMGGKKGDNRFARITSFKDLSTMKIVHQSITGILENEIALENFIKQDDAK
jgi:hypothetical protein